MFADFVKNCIPFKFLMKIVCVDAVEAIFSSAKCKDKHFFGAIVQLVTMLLHQMVPK